jgi:hypothetical protein
MTIMTVCISTFRRKPMLHLTAGLVLRELNLAACYTIARGIVTSAHMSFWHMKAGCYTIALGIVTPGAAHCSPH